VSVSFRVQESHKFELGSSEQMAQQVHVKAKSVIFTHGCMEETMSWDRIDRIDSFEVGVAFRGLRVR
jgi:hypothetical protein